MARITPLCRLHFALFFLAVVSASLNVVLAQVANAALSGTVRDQTGAVLRGVEITLESQRTGWVRTVSTDREGVYRFASLQPGNYSMHARHAGFETQVVRGLELTVGGASNLDFTLTVSPLEQAVTVESDRYLIERESPALSSTLRTIQIEELPIDGRGYLDFTLLTPGVSDGHTLAAERPVQAPTSGLSFSGQDQRSTSVRIDGVDNLDDISNSPRATLSQEAIQEFQVSRAAYSSTSGGARGGAINILSKSGGNRFHGSAFGFFRDEQLDARNTFAKRLEGAPEPRFERRQFGGSVGGPLRRDRAFFFVAYEGQLRDESQFVTFLDDRGIFQPTASQNELFGFLLATGDPGLESLAAAFIDPSFGLLRTLPTTFPATLDLFEAESGAFPFRSELHSFSLRLDQQLNPANQAFGRFSLTDYRNDNTDFGALEGVSNGVQFDVTDQALVLGDLHAFSPVTLNDFRFQYARRNLQVETNDPIGPEISIAGVAEFGREFLNPTRYKTDLFEFRDQLNWIRGRHSFAAGIDAEVRQRRGDAEVFLGGQFAFGEAIPLAAVLDSVFGSSFAQGLAGQLSTPVDLGGFGRPDLAAHLLAPITSLQAFNLGLPITYFQGFGDPSTDVPVKRLGAFLHDSWRITEGLTLSLGMRYDTSWRTPTLNLASAETPFDFRRGAVNDHNNFAPRLGFAWRPWGGDPFTVRGGYGIYYQNLYGALEVTSSVLSGQISQVFLPLTGLPGIPVSSADIWAYMQQTGANGREALAHFGIEPGTTPSIILPGDPNLENPYSHQATLGIARDLGRQWAIELDYSMNSGVHLIRSRDYNVRATNPGQFGFPGLDPRYVQVPVMESGGNSVYHGMTAGLRKRFSSGVALNVAYTLGKAIDDTTDFIIELGPQDHTNLRDERALSSFDQRHRLVLSGIFQTPHRLWRGRRFLNAAARDWTLAPIVVWGSGKPFNLLSGFDRNGDTHEETDRPLTLAGGSVGRNTGRGPGFFTTDLRLSRRIAMPFEESRLEFSCELFNLFNNTNYSQVNGVFGSRVLDTGDVRGSADIPANQPLGYASAFDPRRVPAPGAAGRGGRPDRHGPRH